MSLPRQVHAVVFDMDGLLLDTETVYQAGLINAAAAIGHELPPAIYRQMIGLSGDAGRLVLRGHFGPDFPLEDYDRVCGVEMEKLLAAGVRLKTGVGEILDHLEAAAMPRAVATSTSRYWAERHLAEVGIRHRFHAVVTRTDVAHAKPHPDLFLKAADLLAVEPAHCLALEDSHNGVRAAHAAGMMAVMVPDLLEPTDEMHDKCATIAADLHAVLDLLRSGSRR